MATVEPENVGESLRLILGAGDPLARLPGMHDAFARAAELCTQAHSPTADTDLEMQLSRLESGSASDLLAGSPDGCVDAILLAPKWDCSIFVRADRPLVFALVELLLGGDGSEPPYSQERAFTNIETRIAAIFFERIASAMSGALSLGSEAGFVLEEGPPEAVTAALGEETGVMVVAHFNVSVFEQSGQLQIVIPAAALEAMRGALKGPPAKAARAPDQGWTRHIESEISRSSVKLKAILDEHCSTLAQISALKTGQVLQLSATPDTLVRVECNGERMFWCRLGQSKGAYTLQIEEFVDSGQEFINDVLPV